jgi:hypothetical protein
MQGAGPFFPHVGHKVRMDFCLYIRDERVELIGVVNRGIL